jgi:hypothetical protein
LPELNGEKKIEKVFLPIEEVEPEVSEANNEKAKVNPIGMLETQLTKFLNKINDLNIISYSKDTTKEETFSEELSKLDSKI